MLSTIAANTQIIRLLQNLCKGNYQKIRIPITPTLIILSEVWLEVSSLFDLYVAMEIVKVINKWDMVFWWALWARIAYESVFQRKEWADLNQIYMCVKSAFVELPMYCSTHTHKYKHTRTHTVSVCVSLLSWSDIVGIPRLSKLTADIIYREKIHS